MALRCVGRSSPHESMAAKHKTLCVQPGLPAFLGADRRRVVQQPVLLLLLGQPGELGVERDDRAVRNVSLRCRIGGLALAA